MANLTENTQNPVWSAGIYQIETSDPVLGGANGIANRQAKELAARTQWLKTELARSIALINTHETNASNKYALKTTQINAGAGLTGGGILRDNTVLSLGTPSKITATTTNSAVSNTHTHEIDKASTSIAGIVRLSSDTHSDAENLAATPKAIKTLFNSLLGSLKTMGYDDLDKGTTSRAGIDLNTLNQHGSVTYINYGTVNKTDANWWQNYNLPSNEITYGVVQTYRENANIIYQILYSAGNGQVWFRYRNLSSATALNNKGWTRLDGTDWADIRNKPEDFSNLCLNPSMKTNTEDWTSGVGREQVGGEWVGLVTLRDQYYGSPQTANEGELFYCAAWVKNKDASHAIRIGIASNKVADNAPIWKQAASATPANATDWLKIEGYVAVPSGYRNPRLWVSIEKTANAAGTFYIKNIEFRRASVVAPLQNDAVKISGNQTIEGVKTFSNVPTLSNNAPHLIGRKGGNLNWFMGNGGESHSNVALHSYVHGHGIELQTDKIQTTKPIYVNTSKVALDNEVVKIAGAQTVVGEKTFDYQIKLNKNIGGTDYGARFGTNNNDTFIQNLTSGKYIQLKNDGAFMYHNQRVFHEGFLPTFAQISSKPTTLSGYGITDAVTLNTAQTISGVKDFAGGTLIVSGAGEWAGIQAKNTLEGKHVYFDGTVANVCRGSYQVVSEGSGRYVAKICTTPVGATNVDRRVVAMTISETSIHTHAYGWLHENFVPAGAIAYIAADNVPAGWLKANGAAVSRTVFANLFRAIGTRFGGGDGRSTFNLPDLRGEFIRGWDDGRGADGGRGLGTWQGDEFRWHQHYVAHHINARPGIAGSDLDGNSYVASHATNGEMERYGLKKTPNMANVGLTSPMGGNETRPRNVALLAIIKI